MTSRVTAHHLAQGGLRAPPRWPPRGVCPGDRSARTVPAVLPERLVVTARSPPISVSPGAPVAVVEGVRRIDGSGCPPVGVLVDQPATWAQALRHLPDRLLLPADEMEQRKREQTRSNEPGPRARAGPRGCRARTPPGSEARAAPGTGVDVGRDHVPRRTDLLGQPHRHRASPRRDLQDTSSPAGPAPAAGATPDRRAAREESADRPRPPPGPRQQGDSRARRREPLTLSRGPRLRHGDNVASGAWPSKRVLAAAQHFKCQQQ